MSQLSLEGRVIFVVDYRSPPSGCGTIARRDGSLVLVQHEGCKPEVLEGEYDEIIYISYDMGEEYEKGSEELFDVFEREGVEVVCDGELALQHELGSEYMLVEKFIELVRFYY